MTFIDASNNFSGFFCDRNIVSNKKKIVILTRRLGSSSEIGSEQTNFDKSLCNEICMNRNKASDRTQKKFHQGDKNS